MTYTTVLCPVLWLLRLWVTGSRRDRQIVDWVEHHEGQQWGDAVVSALHDGGNEADPTMLIEWAQRTRPRYLTLQGWL